jgi:hypothetical protein
VAGRDVVGGERRSGRGETWWEGRDVVGGRDVVAEERRPDRHCHLPALLINGNRDKEAWASI